MNDKKNKTHETNYESFRNKLRVYNKKELCHLYGVTYKTFHKWLQPFHNEIGIRTGNYFTVLQVKTIFMKLGEP